MGRTAVAGPAIYVLVRCSMTLLWPDRMNEMEEVSDAENDIDPIMAPLCPPAGLILGEWTFTLCVTFQSGPPALPSAGGRH